jgi:hypothetical protein
MPFPSGAPSRRCGPLTKQEPLRARSGRPSGSAAKVRTGCSTLVTVGLQPSPRLATTVSLGRDHSPVGIDLDHLLKLLRPGAAERLDVFGPLRRARQVGIALLRRGEAADGTSFGPSAVVGRDPAVGFRPLLVTRAGGFLLEASLPGWLPRLWTRLLHSTRPLPLPVTSSVSPRSSRTPLRHNVTQTGA